MAYKARIRKVNKVGKGSYFTQSMSVSTWIVTKIFVWPFKAMWLLCKYTIGLPFIIVGKCLKKS